MRRTTRLLQPLLLGLAFAAAPGSAQEPRAPAPAPASAPAATPAPAPALDPDLAALGAALAQERRMLKADGSEFAVFATPARTPATQGTLLLIPGDGSHPTSAAGLEQIRQAMPAHGWATWLLTLEPPPRAHAMKITPPGGSPPAISTTSGDETGTAAATATGAAAPAGEAPVTLAAQRTAALEQWAARSQARIVAAIASAASEGRPLALVAEGSSAVLLTRAMGSAPGSVRAAALLDPVELPGLAPEWPRGLARPVMEVLGPAASHEQGRRRREQAAERQLAHYRQLTLETASWRPGPADAPLTRRLRGWLTTLERTPGAAAGDG